MTDYTYVIPSSNHLPQAAKDDYQTAANTAIKELDAMLSNGAPAQTVVAWFAKWASVATPTHLGKALVGYAKHTGIAI
jgi:hypothetical protein